MARMFALLALLCWSAAAGAAPVRYDLQAELSTVGFSYVMAGQRTNGRMPVKSAEIVLDFDRPARSSVRAVIDAANADAGPVYADVAMRGADVLNTADFPEIIFESTRIAETADGAVVEGRITIRGVTRPIRLRAEFFRQRGTDAGDRSRLSVVLRGSVSRQDFGASGYGGLVGDRIDLTILARIRRGG